MARIVKTAEVRRSEILDAAGRLFIRHGYDATSVQMILDELRLSKGAFYHHFESKEQVMEELAQRFVEEMFGRLAPLADRRELSPLEKLNLTFGTGSRYKRERVEAFRIFADIYCRDANRRLRDRMVAIGIEVVGPLYTRILDEGMRDGTFTIEDPAETARLIFHLGTFLQDGFTEAWKRADHDRPGAVAQYRRRVDAYSQAVERILGLDPHTLMLIDDDTIELFLSQERS